MDSSANLKQVGEVIETLIHIKDSLYSELTFEQKVSLEDACNLLSHHLGDFTKYDWQYNLKRVLMDSFTILVDFDDTCCRDSYPHRGEEIPGAVSVLRDLCKKGHRLILWTCREHVSIDGVDPLQEALNWFSSYDIPLYAVNEDPCVGRLWMFPSRKVHGDLLIDDKALGIPKTDGVVDWKSARKLLESEGII